MSAPPERFVLRQMCNLAAPEDLAAWILLDRRTGVPLCDARSIRHFTREEALAERARLRAAEEATGG